MLINILGINPPTRGDSMFLCSAGFGRGFVPHTGGAKCKETAADCCKLLLTAANCC